MRLEQIEMDRHNIKRIQIVDSHTGGEPTRLVIGGGPDLGRGSLAERREIFRRDHDTFRSAVVNEPRGSDAVVGALLCEPVDPKSTAGVIFFNNVGYLGMCGHGTIGLLATLAYMGRIQPGEHRIETPAGTVTATLRPDGMVSVQNVPAYRHLKGVEVDVPGRGKVRGDVAWGGNWFFLINEHPMQLTLQDLDALTEYTWLVRQQLERQGITGRDGAEIDHIELYGRSSLPGVQSKNFVLCPGKAYDRSPCGTGTSAKLACLFEDGKIRENEVWRQESIVGSVFEGFVTRRDGQVIPTITGSAFVNAEAELVLDENDPFCLGIRR